MNRDPLDPDTDEDPFGQREDAPLFKIELNLGDGFEEAESSPDAEGRLG